MKQFNLIQSVLPLSFAILLPWTPLQAQTTKDKTTNDHPKSIATVIAQQDYTFRAQSIVPTNGPRKELNGYYDLQVTAGKVVSFLPYMGRIYMPPTDPSSGPLRFTSTDFVYTEQAGKKGGWNVSIKPKDVRSVHKFALTVSEDGYATLQVTGNDRQPVTFYGYIVGNENG